MRDEDEKMEEKERIEVADSTNRTHSLTHREKHTRENERNKRYYRKTITTTKHRKESNKVRESIISQCAHGSVLAKTTSDFSIQMFTATLNNELTYPIHTSGLRAFSHGSHSVDTACRPITTPLDNEPPRDWSIHLLGNSERANQNYSQNQSDTQLANAAAYHR